MTPEQQAAFEESIDGLMAAFAAAGFTDHAVDWDLGSYECRVHLRREDVDRLAVVLREVHPAR